MGLLPQIRGYVQLKAPKTQKEAYDLAREASSMPLPENHIMAVMNEPVNSRQRQRSQSPRSVRFRSPERQSSFGSRERNPSFHSPTRRPSYKPERNAPFQPETDNYKQSRPQLNRGPQRHNFNGAYNQRGRSTTQCFRCGRWDCLRSNCPAFFQICHHCGLQGHLATICQRAARGIPPKK